MNRRKFIVNGLTGAAGANLAFGSHRLLRAASPKSVAAGTNMSVTIDASRPGHVIPANVLGLHMEYAWQPVAVYANGHIADWARRVHAGTARYPGGGTVKYWDWQHPTGNKQDPWAPGYNPALNAPAADYMDLDQYLAFCKRSGCAPLVGVNCTSGYLYHRMADSIARGAACVKYCIDHGQPVHYWYIGNETEGPCGGWLNYLKICRAHADAMLAIDPSLCIFVNNNKITPASVKQAIDIMGHTLGGIEFHGKWKEGGERGLNHPGTFSGWSKEDPPIELWGQSDGDVSYAQRLVPIRKAAAAAGRPDLVLADNEWGIGKVIEGFDRYTTSLLLIDLLQDHIIGGYDMACFWDMVGNDDKKMMNSQVGYKFNPIARGYELLSTAVGQHFLSLTSSNHLVYGFGCTDNKAQSMQVYLLNKTPDAQSAEIKVKGLAGAVQNAQGKMLVAPGNELTALPVSVQRDSTTCILPSLSYARVTMSIDNVRFLSHIGFEF